jgi:hypothetical protein
VLLGTVVEEIWAKKTQKKLACITRDPDATAIILLCNKMTRQKSFFSSERQQGTPQPQCGHTLASKVTINTNP